MITFIKTWIYHIWCYSTYMFQNRTNLFEDLNKLNKNSKELIIYIHGLNGSPSRSFYYLNKIQELDSKIDIIAPKLTNNIDESVKIISNIIDDYYQQYPQNKITIICYSYGGIIGKIIDEKYDNIQMIIYYIAVPFKGTKIMDWNIINNYINNDLLKYDEKKIVNFNLNPKKYRTFIASYNDERVYPIETSLPNDIIGNITHKFEGYTHYTILYKAFDIIINNIY